MKSMRPHKIDSFSLKSKSDTKVSSPLFRYCLLCFSNVQISEEGNQANWKADGFSER